MSSVVPSRCEGDTGTSAAPIIDGRCVMLFPVLSCPYIQSAISTMVPSHGRSLKAPWLWTLRRSKLPWGKPQTVKLFPLPKYHLELGHRSFALYLQRTPASTVIAWHTQGPTVELAEVVVGENNDDDGMSERHSPVLEVARTRSLCVVGLRRQVTTAAGRDSLDEHPVMERKRTSPCAEEDDAKVC